LDGGSANDTLDGGVGHDILNGGAHIDRVTYATSADAVTVDLTAGIGRTNGAGPVYQDTIIGVENVTGSAQADLLIGDGAGNRLDGGDGDDTLRSGDGDDILTGGAGTDLLEGGAGLDIVDYSGSPSSVTVFLPSAAVLTGATVDDFLDSIEGVIGSDFDDLLVGNDDGINDINGGGGDDLLRGGLGTNYFTGGDGSDTVDFSQDGRDSGVSVAFDDFSGENVLFQIENAIGTQFSDMLTGNSDNNWLQGGDGDDTLKGLFGSDTFSGGAGSDYFEIRDLTDTIFGGEGIDTFGFSVFFGSVSITLDVNETDTGGMYLVDVENLNGTSFHDTLTGNAGANTLDGQVGNDTLFGGDGEDRLLGNFGLDQLSGGTGMDQLFGGDLADTLDGGADDDFLVGGTGADTLFGGAGSDTLFGNIETPTTTNDGLDTLYGGDGDDWFALQDSTLFPEPDAFLGDAGYDSLLLYRNTDLSPMFGVEEIFIMDSSVQLSVTKDLLDDLQKITGDGGGMVFALDGWSRTLEGLDYDTYMHSSGSMLLIDRDLTVTIA
jgi:Ca2+-binding RTX toxin-like protein